MTPTKVRERLAELDGAVEPAEYAAALFYVHGDGDRYAACLDAARPRGGTRTHREGLGAGSPARGDRRRGP